MPEDKGLSRSQKEEKILQFWKENEIFHKSLGKTSPKGEFVFYEGPPTANGKPAIHHLEARVFKDAIPRYKTMQGYHVRRKAGWDTHGLPVELEVEKILGLKSKKEIEEYGVAKFNEMCKESVWKYVDIWQKFTERIGYWVDQRDAYVTYSNPYIQAVWSVLAQADKKDLLYKDYKVVPWCPRCGTALSSHELAQGYADVKDLSVYAKFKVLGQENTYLLAWTTTPWTLPGNVALAVGEDMIYVKLKMTGGEFLILAESRLQVIGEEYEIVEKLKGEDIVGYVYEPLYPFLKDNYQGEGLGKAYQVYAADFVTDVDGTGIVHTAVMYGQDDFELGTSLGLPKFHLVDETGHFKNFAGIFSGLFVKDEETAVEVIKDLAHRGLLYKKEKFEHSYPHCWRCKTPLIYYARDSWYLRMSELRAELVDENEKINWEPDYIKEGRFGEWLREIKDWAISRERYWGTPLPIWQTTDGSKRIVVSTVEDLKKYTKKSGNTYFVMRHGGTDGNKKEIVSYKAEGQDHLTAEGRKQTEISAQALKNKRIDMIVASPFLRTRETAEVVREILGLPKEAVVFDERLIEVNPGDFDGKNWQEYHDYIYNLGPDWFKRQIPGGESLVDVGKRMGNALYELESIYKDKKILIITHGGPAWLLYVTAGLFTPDHKEYKKADTHVFVNDFKRFDNAEVRELPFIPLPHNDNFELDLHKPYIDDIVLEKDGEEYSRTKEVMDVWFDSGSVPFAQDADHRADPGDFSNILYPADFISEGMDQTRGWFYTMHAIAILMDKGRAYKNVICLGLINDKDGKKMSKSVGNVIDPWEQIEKYGVDTLRLWMYSVNQPGESKNFDERSVDEIQKRIFNLLDNVYSFYDLYRDRTLEAKGLGAYSSHVLDMWIMIRLAELTNDMTNKLDSYKLLEPVRMLREFIDDLSTWYLRRSRDRIKDGDVNAKRTLYLVLKQVAHLLAPFAPFYADEFYQKLKIEEEPESVHLSDWPQAEDTESDEVKNLLQNMEVTRSLVSLALEQRSKANIKVRQPLSKLTIKNTLLGSEYLDIIKDELNVKSVVQDVDIEGDVSLDTDISPELEEEGMVREEIRNIQDMRKEKNLKPGDILKITIPKDKEDLYEKFRTEIKKATNVEF